MTKSLFIKLVVFISVSLSALFILYKPVFANRCAKITNKCIPDSSCIVRSDDAGNTVDNCSTSCTADSDCSGFGAIGIVKPPPGVVKYGGGSFCKGLIPFANNILRIFFIVSGLYGLINILVAGFLFMQAGGDAKQIEKAWGRIWQSFVGLLILVASFLIAAIIGIVIFGNPTALLNPVITGAPGAVCP